MYICDYCGRHLKKKFDKCPGCGSDKFTHSIFEGVEIIKKPPKDGYKVNIEYYNKEKKTNNIPKIFGIIFIVFVSIFLFTFFYAGISLVKENEYFGIIFVIVSIIFLIASIKHVWYFFKLSRDANKDVDNRISKINKLTTKGILIKNLPYKVENAKNMNGIIGNDYCIKVVFEIEKGRTLSLKSEPKKKFGRADGTVDVLIDPDDYNNYFIDFEIY